MAAPTGEKIYAIFNPAQLEKFCAKFMIDPQDLEVDIRGWHKYAVLTPTSVFLFPRDPSFQANVLFEHELNSLLHSVPELAGFPIPELSVMYFDPFINYYQFRKVSRSEGIRLDKILNEFSFDEIEIILNRLYEFMAQLHSYSLDHFASISKFLSKIPRNTNKPSISKKNVSFSIETPAAINLWSNSLLNTNLYKESYDQIILLVKKSPHYDKIPHIADLLTFLEVNKEFTLRTISQLHEIQPVLIHGDIHENQIFIDNERDPFQIINIIDWESARLSHPIWEFNLGEWGEGLWKWDQKNHGLLKLRENLWIHYCKIREIDKKTSTGMQLFYLLNQSLNLLKKVNELTNNSVIFKEITRKINFQLNLLVTKFEYIKSRNSSSFH